MSSDAFPEHIDPQKLFSQSGSLNGSILLSRLARLSAYSGMEEGKNNESSSQVKAHLTFRRDDNNRPVVAGPINATLQMQCQRCLEPTSVEVTTELNVTLINRQSDSEKLATDADWIQSKVADLAILELIEDEIILSLPIVVNHQNDDCNQQLSALQEQAANESASISTKSNSFASLEALKNSLKQ